jgi:hypothetical protein
MNARRTGPALDLGVAALAAAALGFVMFAMPGALFETLVVRTGLPDFVGAAQPPLGTTARGAAIAAAALAGFAVVLVLLRGLDRIQSRPRRKAEAPVDSEAPKLRRADAHPDAPARRPLLAGRELSEPLEDFEDFEPEPVEMFADLPAQPLPGFLAGEEEEPAEEPIDAEHADGEDALILDQRADEDGFADDGEEASDEESIDERADQDDFADDGEEASDEESIDERAFASLVSRLPDGPEEVGGESITDLMRRLESGLSRREQAEEGAELDAPAEDAVAAAPDTPSWLAPQPRAAEAEDIDAPAEDETMPEESEAPSWLALRSRAAGADPASAPAQPAPAQPVAAQPAAAQPAAAQPLVDEFGEPCWPARADHRDVSPPDVVADETPAEEPASQAYEPPPAPAQIGHRLRNAIGEMQKQAARGG